MTLQNRTKSNTLSFIQFVKKKNHPYRYRWHETQNQCWHILDCKCNELHWSSDHVSMLHSDHNHHCQLNKYLQNLRCWCVHFGGKKSYQCTWHLMRSPYWYIPCYKCIVGYPLQHHESTQHFCRIRHCSLGKYLQKRIALWNGLVCLLTCADHFRIRARIGESRFASAHNGVGLWIMRTSSITVTTTIIHQATICTKIESEKAWSVFLSLAYRMFTDATAIRWNRWSRIGKARFTGALYSKCGRFMATISVDITLTIVHLATI